MKLLSFRVGGLFCLFLMTFISQDLYADGYARACVGDRDSLEQADLTPLSDTTTYERRVEHYQKRWSRLIPTHMKAQFAGSMGLISLGTGWDYGRRNQWETDVLIGFVPKFSTHKVKVTITVKQNYMPWSVALGSGGFSMEPLACGIYVNSVLGGDFWRRQPSRYPNKYYTFSTKMRFNAFIGQRFTYTRPDSLSRKFTRSITIFYEISTNDFYIMSAVQNRYLKLSDILGLSFGVKFQIF